MVLEQPIYSTIDYHDTFDFNLDWALLWRKIGKSKGNDEMQNLYAFLKATLELKEVN